MSITMMLVCSVAFAQSTVVKGTVKDKNLGEGESFATIRIFPTGKSEGAIAMFLTDADGNFNQNVEGNGTYDIVISSVGKEDIRQSITLGNNKELDLGTILMNEDAKTLAGVEVVAQKPLVKMEVDKMTYRVEDDVDSKSSTVLDMLRKVPMVSVDGQDNITVNGSSAFKVYVDGKPNVMFSSNPSMIFKSMPASMVKTIEVVTNPGARFDAEGASGVLNIVMNKQMMSGLGGAPGAAPSADGYNGTIRASIGTRALGGGVMLSGQKGKFSYSANVMENYSKPGATVVEMDQENGGTTIRTVASTKTRLPFTLGSLSLGYDLDAMSSVNATFSLTSLSLRNTGLTTTQMLFGQGNNGFSYDNNMKMKNGRTSFSANLDYQRFFNPERTKSIIVTYQLSLSPSKTEQRNDFEKVDNTFIDLTDRYSDVKDNTTDHTVQVDYTTPLATGQTFNTGAKLMTRKATSDSKYYLDDVFDNNQSLDYEYRNTILAGYTEYEGSFDKYSAKAGLRYEHTWQDVEYHFGNGTNFSKDYGCLVPSASVSFSPSMTSNIGLTYNMRISRPGITYLNPYVDHSDPNSLTYGNTNLDVEKSHNIALVYNLFTSKLMMNLNLHYNYTGNGIEQYSFYDNNLLNTTYGNIVKRSQTGVNVFANWLALKDTRLFVNGSLNYTDMRSDNVNSRNHGWQATAMMGIQQTLPLDLKLSTYLITSSKTKTLQGYTSGFNMLTASLSKTFFNDKLTVGVTALTGLSSGGDLKIESYSSGTNFSQRTSIKVPMSGLTLSVSYTFGKSNFRTKQHVSKVTNDYIEQQSQGEILNSAGGGTGTGAGAGMGGGTMTR
ncbi:MAG: TonB-dependent receptor [Prevotella sp.]|nr:TonB-dependent receptor [Prevotella sp.]